MTFEQWWKKTGYGWEDAHGHQTSPKEIAKKAWQKAWLEGHEAGERFERIESKVRENK